MRVIGIVVPLAVCLAAPAASAADAPAPRSAPAATPETTRLDALRASLRKEAGTPEQERAQSAAARELLDALDRQGEARSPEAAQLVDRLLLDVPDDAVLLWRRAEIRRRAQDNEGAIADLELLLRAHPGDPLAVRARRALPQVYLLSGRREQSAQADEYLLASNLADASAVLSRLARTYAQIGDVPRQRDALHRLERVAPDALRIDPELMWLYADAADRAGTRPEAGAALMRFANVFPQDPRRAEALLRAGRAYQAQGQQEFALKLMDESVHDASSQQVEVAGRIGRGQVLETLGQRQDARQEYERVLAQATDKETAARALGRTVDLTVEIEGREAALRALAGKIASNERFAAEEGREQFVKIANGLGEELAADGARALYVVELARRAGVENRVSPALRLAAAGLRERVGSTERAAAIYQSLATVPDPKIAGAARDGLLRCRPRDVPAGASADDPERLAALEREESWSLVLKAIAGSVGKNDVALRPRTLGARAAFMVHDPTWASELLAPVQAPTGETAILRADARALAGDWPAACRDYRGAPGPDLGPALGPWLQLRIAACEAREEKFDDARGRLQALLNGKPPEPVTAAAEQLLAATPAPDTTGRAHRGRRSAR